jgi:hypothetical protein
MDQRKDASEPKAERKLEWESPVMEEVTERVMAQPYIRFT